MKAADYAAGMSETGDLQPAVIGLAKALGWLVYHTHDSRKSEAGYPDLTMVRKRDGRTVVAELKDATRKPTQAQLEWLHAFSRGPVEAYLWRPAHLIDGTIRRVLSA